MSVDYAGFEYRINPDLSDHRGFDSLQRYWAARQVGDRLPARADIDPADLRAHLGHLNLIDVPTDLSDFRYRLIGTATSEQYGRDSTGKSVRELYGERDPAMCAWLLHLYRTVAEKRFPVRAIGPLRIVNREHLAFDALYLPLANDGTTVDMLLAEVFFHPTAG